MTVVRELGWIQHAIDIAIRDWGIPLRENVVKRARRPRVDNRRERRLGDGEWERLIRAAHECGNALMLPPLVLALETGMRRGEFVSMVWHDFDQERCTVTLSRTKNGHPRTVPLTPLAVTTFAALPRTHALRYTAAIPTTALRRRAS